VSTIQVSTDPAYTAVLQDPSLWVLKLPSLLASELPEEGCFLKENGGQGSRYTYLEVYTVSFQPRPLRVTSNAGYNFSLGICIFSLMHIIGVDAGNSPLLFLHAWVTDYVLTAMRRCFGDKGDVEDITEGTTTAPPH
jgi:hypothetical protein